MTENKNLSFEEKIKKLESIVNELESGEVALDDAINKYTEAMKLSKECSDKLNEVKKFFISETIPCKENYERVGKEIKSPVFVGPIRKLDNNNCITENKLIINIGGAESFLLNRLDYGLNESCTLLVLQTLFLTLEYFLDYNQKNLTHLIMYEF